MPHFAIAPASLHRLRRRLSERDPAAAAELLREAGVASGEALAERWRNRVAERTGLMARTASTCAGSARCSTSCASVSAGARCLPHRWGTVPCCSKQGTGRNRKRTRPTAPPATSPAAASPPSSRPRYRRRSTSSRSSADRMAPRPAASLPAHPPRWRPSMTWSPRDAPGARPSAPKNCPTEPHPINQPRRSGRVTSSPPSTISRSHGTRSPCWSRRRGSPPATVRS